MINTKGWGALYAAATAPETQPEGGQGLTLLRQSIKTTEELDALVYASLYDATKPATQPDFRLRCHGVGLFPLGSITAISGQEKQGKTQFLTALAAVMMSGRSFGSMQAETPARCVLWADTEQNDYNISRNLSRLYALAGVAEGTPTEQAGLRLLSLADHEVSERLEILQRAIELFDPDVVVIDGVRDLLNDFNDVKESNDVMAWMIRNRKGRNLFAVLHTNDGSTKMRGHLGTELMHKCDDRFDVVAQGDVFKATHTSRNQRLAASFFFRFDKDFNLVPTDTADPSEAVSLIEPAETTLHTIMDGREHVPFDEIVRAFAKAQGITQTKAKDFCKQKFIDARLIVKSGDGVGWQLA